MYFDLPRADIYVSYDDYISEDKIKISYESRIRVSKLMDIFKVTHLYTLSNPDPRAFSKRLCEERYNVFYIMQQLELDKLVKKIGQDNAYLCMDYSLENYVIEGLKFDHDGMLFFWRATYIGYVII